MGKVLTTASTVKCQHQGQVQLTETQSLLKVKGQSVLVAQLQGSISPDPEPGHCPQPKTPAGGKPCSKVINQSESGGTSSVLKVNGKPVLLDSLSGETDGNPEKGWSVEDARQQILQAN